MILLFAQAFLITGHTQSRGGKIWESEAPDVPGGKETPASGHARGDPQGGRARARVGLVTADSGRAPAGGLELGRRGLAGSPPRAGTGKVARGAPAGHAWASRTPASRRRSGTRRLSRCRYLALASLPPAGLLRGGLRLSRGCRRASGAAGRAGAEGGAGGGRGGAAALPASR